MFSISEGPPKCWNIVKNWAPKNCENVFLTPFYPITVRKKFLGPFYFQENLTPSPQKSEGDPKFCVHPLEPQKHGMVWYGKTLFNDAGPDSN
jgi:hypothetical protein